MADSKATKTSEKSSKATKKAPDKKKGGIKKWFKDLRSEFKKVIWPTKKQIINNTGVVLAAMAVSGIFIWALDLGLSQLLKFVLGGGNT